jgi:hypothetical protein
VAVNGADETASFELEVPGRQEGALVDLLNPGATFAVSGGRARIEVWSHWARVLRVAA